VHTDTKVLRLTPYIKGKNKISRPMALSSGTGGSFSSNEEAASLRAR